MSTRGVIARRTPAGGFCGVYNHSDSYPTWMGHHLWELLFERFKGDVTAMLRVLIDEHSPGWSVIGETCFCHPSGHLTRMDPHRQPETEPDYRTDENLDEDDTDIEWLYVFDEAEHALFVRDVSRHAPAGIVDLTEAEPDWGIIECGENLERCGHYAVRHFPELEGTPMERLGTHTYLGSQPFEFRDAIAFYIRGKRYKATGSGCHSDYVGSDLEKTLPWRVRKEISGSACWIAMLENPHGKSVNLPVAYVEGDEYRPFKGVTWIFPPRKGNPCETLQGDESGEVQVTLRRLARRVRETQATPPAPSLPQATAAAIP